MNYKEFLFSIVFIILGYYLMHSNYKNPDKQLPLKSAGRIMIGFIAFSSGIVLLLKSIFNFEI